VVEVGQQPSRALDTDNLDRLQTCGHDLGEQFVRPVKELSGGRSSSPYPPCDDIERGTDD
jgi:hypothetical protein